MIKINRSTETIYDAPITSGAKCVCKLMEEDYIVLPFSTREKIYFEIGDYVDLGDDCYDSIGLFNTIRKKYVVTSKQLPTYNTTDGGYDWSLRLDAYYWAWNNRIFKFNPTKCAQEASWGLTDKIGKFMEMFCNNLEAYGFGELEYVVADYLSDYNINLSFEGTRMIDALKMICDKITEEYNVECEWWVRNSTIYIGRCEEESYETITNEGDDVNAVKITSEEADAEYANRVIIFGGTQNLSARYRKNLYFEASEATAKTNGTLIRDNIKTNFSPEWFKVSERVYKTPISVSSSTNVENGYIKEDAQRITERYKSDFTYTREIGKVTPGNTVQLFNYNINAEVSVNDYNVVTNGYPFKDSKGPNYKLSAVYARLYIERGSKSFDIEQVADTTSKELAQLVISGEKHIVSTDFKEGEWTIMLEFKLYLEGNINAQQYGHDNDTSFPIWGNIFAFYNTKSTTVSLKSNDVYKVDTRVVIGENTYYCTVNPDCEDMSSECARDILVKNADVSEGDIYSFPTIVRGKADAGYFTTDESDVVVNGIVNRNLMLPLNFSIYYGDDGEMRIASADDEDTDVVTYAEKNYIDINKDIDASQIVEEVVTFEDIYPKQDFYICNTGFYTSETEEEDANGKDVSIKGGALTKTHYYWQFDLPEFDFTKDCLLEGVDLGVTFQTGKLAGLSFKLAWQPNHDTIGTQDDEHRWEIVNNEDYGIELPNSVVRPYPGDKIIITGWNIEALEGEGNDLIEAAERALLNEGIKKARKLSIEPHTYHVEIMSDYMNDYPTKDYPLEVGKIMTIKNSYLFKDGERKLRVLGYEAKLDIPWDTPVIIVGERLEKSSIRNAKERLDAIDNASIESTPIVTK